MEFSLCLGPHDVYTSLLNVFSNIGDVVFEKRSYIISFGTTHVEKCMCHFESEKIFLFKSPTIQINPWFGLFRNAKMFLFMEYYKKRLVKDAIFSFIFKLFKQYPVIVMTKRSKQFFHKLGFDVFFIPPAAKKRRSLSASKRKHILFLSRMVSSKNPFLFIDLAKALPNEKFIMIGRGPLADKIRKAVKSIDNVEYIEWVDSKDELFSKYISKAKLLIHTAKKDPIGYVIPEALSVSVPVLATSSTGASDFLPKEWVMSTFDLSVWKSNVSRILNNLENSINMANETFSKEHLNINDEYFDKLSISIKEYICKRWGCESS